MTAVGTIRNLADVDFVVVWYVFEAPLLSSSVWSYYGAVSSIYEHHKTPVVPKMLVGR